MGMKRQIGIGVIGLGHWGPNHVRVFNECQNAKVVACTDLEESRRSYIRRLYPDVAVMDATDGIFERDDIDAVVIATPAHTHYHLAKAALKAHKHILIEKPICNSVKEAEELAVMSRKTGLVMMQGHVFLYNRGIQFIKKGLDRGDFGNIQYFHATRTNLGPIRHDVNVVRDLATHEFSIFDYFFGRLPRWISVAASKPLHTPREDVAFLSMEYPGGILAHVHVSWLHPQKIRMLTLVGDKRMVVWDDMNLAEPVRVYNKGVIKEPYYDSFGEFQMRLRDMDMMVPNLDVKEPLQLQAQAFLHRMRNGGVNGSEIQAGLRVMKCLEAAEKSLRSDGKRIYLKREAVIRE